MITTDNHKRSSGILAHLSSLPSPYGIGDMGPGAFSFLQFLQKSKQSIWQILPLGPTAPVFEHSPYMTISAFAGNPLFISPQRLYEEGLISRNELDAHPALSPYSVDFKTVTKQKESLLQQAYSRFDGFQSHSFQAFLAKSPWLQEYCLFRALKELFHDKPWYSWESGLVKRQSQLLKEARISLEEKLRYFEFEQYLFSCQWQELQTYASDCGVRIFGDIPIYVSLDSVDVWANQDIFLLDADSSLPPHVAGVPPDYFSETGQKWGNPLYCWNSENTQVQENLLQWWIDRFNRVFEQVDIARIDHFRGFESYWSVPAEHDTALKGKWHKGPGADFFHTVFHKTGPLHIVAEDLGEITQEVIDLRQQLDFPGMKVLQFAFDGNIDNDFLPFNYSSSQYVVYTGTHDNDTSVGWYLSDKIDDTIRSRVKSMVNRDLHDGSQIHRDLIYMAMSSVAATCIIPLQDVLGFGSDCRMNTPGTTEGNWSWRCSDEFLTDDIAAWLARQTEQFGRVPEQRKSGI